MTRNPYAADLQRCYFRFEVHLNFEALSNMYCKPVLVYAFLYHRVTWELLCATEDVDAACVHADPIARLVYPPYQNYTEMVDDFAIRSCRKYRGRLCACTWLVMYTEHLARRADGAKPSIVYLLLLLFAICNTQFRIVFGSLQHVVLELLFKGLVSLVILAALLPYCFKWLKLLCRVALNALVAKSLWSLLFTTSQQHLSMIERGLLLHCTEVR